jgi:prefoldin subunit 5
MSGEQIDAVHEKYRKYEGEIARLRETVSRLNRRCQEAESAARTKVEEVLKAGPSLGRALSAWAAGDYKRQLDDTKLQLGESRANIRALDDAWRDILASLPEGTLPPGLIHTMSDALSGIYVTTPLVVPCPICGAIPSVPEAAHVCYPIESAAGAAPSPGVSTIVIKTHKCRGCGLPMSPEEMGVDVRGRKQEYHAYQAKCVEMLRTNLTTSAQQVREAREALETIRNATERPGDQLAMSINGVARRGLSHLSEKRIGEGGPGAIGPGGDMNGGAGGRGSGSV